VSTLPPSPSIRPRTTQRNGCRATTGREAASDGPFAETKEWIAGFDLLDFGNIEEAIDIASQHPMARFGKIELRALWTRE
jgi:hypothetical protein